MVMTTQTTQEASRISSTDNNGDYSTVTPTTLNAAEASIPIVASTTNAYLSAASGTTTGYSVTAKAEPSGNTFTITNAGGVVTRTCTGTTGGCVGGKW